MIEQIDFLRKAAAELRTLAQKDPAIAGALRRMADELDDKARSWMGMKGIRVIGECQTAQLVPGVG
jgi:hypothetical protein